MFQICEDVEAVGFPLQNVYKMTYGNEGATFEPLVSDSATLESLFRSNWPLRRSEAALNPEPVNGYYLSNNVPVVNHLNQFPECIHFLQEIQIVNHF